MSKPDRAPSSAWGLRRDIADGYVTTARDDTIRVVMPEHPDGVHRAGITMSRSTARLLAKRINQCLDETRVK